MPAVQESFHFLLSGSIQFQITPIWGLYTVCSAQICHLGNVKRTGLSPFSYSWLVQKPEAGGIRGRDKEGANDFMRRK